MKQLLFGCMIVIMISSGCNNLPGGAAGGFPKFLVGTWKSDVAYWEITFAPDGARTEPATFSNADQSECYVVGQPRYYDENGDPGPAITQANYDAWVTEGKPDCWCCPHHGYGDVNGDGWIGTSDVALVWNPVKFGLSPVRADVNHDGWVNISDVPEVWNTVKANVGELPSTCPDCP